MHALVTNTWNNTIPSYVNNIPSYVNNIASTTKDTFEAVRVVANSISVKKLLEICFAALNFYSLPNVGYSGFVIGIVFSEKVREVVDKINLLSAERGSSIFFLYAATGFASFITMPVSNIFITLYLSSKCSMLLIERAQRNSPSSSPTRSTFTCDTPIG